MVFKGHIRNGVVVFDTEVPLPEGAEVDVQPAQRRTARGGTNGKAAPTGRRQGKPAKKKRTRAQRRPDPLKGLIGKAKGLPKDFAAQHDHYIHGSRKR